MEKLNLWNELNDFEADIGLFADFCEFVDLGIYYMDGNKDAIKMLHAALRVILHESRRLEKFYGNITEYMAKIKAWQAWE